MKDIGILTFQDGYNFGAALQAYATYRMVRQLGYDAEIIDYRNIKTLDKEVPIRAYKKGGARIEKFLKWYLKKYKEQKKYECVMQFMHKNTLFSIPYSITEAGMIGDNYKGVLIGSDMIWCTRYTGSDYTYMGQGINCKKASYGTSVGYWWDDCENEAIMDSLKDLRHISVREEEVSKKLSNLLHRKISVVCDPTMLLQPEEWKAEFVRCSNVPNDYALVYMDDKEGNCLKSACEYAKKHTMQVKKVDFNLRGFNKTDIIELYSIEDFLTAIHNAKIVFTGSYHGLLFSLYFHVPVCFVNRDQMRNQYIANRLGVEQRNGNKYVIDEMPPIKWDKVNKNREFFRNNSLSILKEILEELTND